MPNANVAAVANRLVERAPGGEMCLVRVSGIRIEAVEVAPVLNRNRGAPEPVARAEAPEFRMLCEFFLHPRHRDCNWEPAAKFPEFVDAHADEKHDEVAIGGRGESAAMDFTHLRATFAISAALLVWVPALRRASRSDELGFPYKVRSYWFGRCCAA